MSFIEVIYWSLAFFWGLFWGYIQKDYRPETSKVRVAVTIIVNWIGFPVALAFLLYRLGRGGKDLIKEIMGENED